MRRVGSLLIDPALGNSPQLLVGRLFLVEHFLQQIRRLACVPCRAPTRPACRRPPSRSARRAVPAAIRHGVHGRLIEFLVHDRLAFFDDAGDAIAVFAASLFVEAFEHLFEPVDLPLRFFEMRLERLPQFG